jgi:hypothetical protein
MCHILLLANLGPENHFHLFTKVTSNLLPPAPAPDASGPVPVTDSLASIYGAALENEAIVSLTLAAALRAPFFLRARAHKAPLSHCPPRLAWRRALRSATAP